MIVRRLPLVLAAAVAIATAACGDDGGDATSGGRPDTTEAPATVDSPATSAASSAGGAEVVSVPDDAATIGEAVDRVAEGGLVLVSPGAYTETVVVDVPGVTLRGTDRNEVIIDGESTRADGVRVTADGVRVQNLTVVDHINNGVLVTGTSGDSSGSYSPEDAEDVPLLQRFEVSHVTASNNALYGIYAFHAQHGVILDSYASGSPDSGIYVGQCEDCDVLVAGNVAEHNAVGFENANASGVTIIGNRFSNNRVGLTLTTDFQEAFIPQRDNVVVGNLIASNHAPDTPAHAEGGYAIGIGLSGAQGNHFARNRIHDHPYAGVVLQASEDVGSINNRFFGNSFTQNAAEVIDQSTERAPATGNCRLDDEASNGPGDPDAPLPDDLGAAACAVSGEIETSDQASAPGTPAGLDYFDVEPGPAQPDWPASEEPGAAPPGRDGEGDLDRVPEPLPGDATSRPELYGVDSYDIVLPGSKLFDERVVK